MWFTISTLESSLLNHCNEITSAQLYLAGTRHTVAHTEESKPIKSILSDILQYYSSSSISVGLHGSSFVAWDWLLLLRGTGSSFSVRQAPALAWDRLQLNVGQAPALA